MKHDIKNEQEMQIFATQYAKDLQGGDVILLSGNLGSGKTTLTQGIARALGIMQDVTSPTFTIMQLYPVVNHKSIKELAHIDTYRVHDEQDLIQIGAQDYIGQKDTLTIIEWPDKLKELLPSIQLKKIEISHKKNKRGRIVTTK